MKCLAPLAGLLAVASAVALQPRRVSYSGYKVVRLSVGDRLNKVNNIISKLDLTTWKGAPRAGAFADIVVPPAQIAAFDRETASMSVEVMHADLGAAIEAESNFQAYAAGSVNASWFDSYHTYADHLQWLNDLHEQFPNNTEIVTSGTSLNGNAITGIHIFGSAGKSVKPGIVIHGTVHAREWIGTMVVEYFAYTLMSQYKSDPEIESFIDKYDFYFFPVVNPDGFIYTQTTNRMWRKNRQTTPGSDCLGHDINRNWAYKWSVPGGASTNPCAEDFKGKEEADAPETRALAIWMKSIKDTQGLKLFIDYHAYSQLFMTPYGYSCSAVAAKDPELQALAKGAVAAIKAVHGVSFRAGPICQTIYQATGSSVDYVNDVIGADYAFTSELRDTGSHGFLLPAEQIVPSGEEAFAGFKHLLVNMK